MPSYNELCYDILELLRGDQISDDTDISERHIMFHIDLQRALWIRNEYNKPGRKIDPQMEQDLGCLKLVEVDAADCCEIKTGCIMLRTEMKMPMFIDLHTGPAITRVGPVSKIMRPYVFTNYQRVPYQLEGKYSSKEVYMFLLNGYMYFVTNNPELQTVDYVNVRGLLANPRDMEDFDCEDHCFSLDDQYPMPNWMIPYIKEQILKQFGVALQIPKDDTNDANESLRKA